MQEAGQQLWQRHGLPGFVPDVLAFLHDPMAVLTARARRQLPGDPLEVAATSPAELPLRVRRSLVNAEPSRSVLILLSYTTPWDAAYIPPGSPWENPFVESFNGRFRDEFLNIELFTTVQEARLLAEQHRIEYNVYRPHSALQGRTPLEVFQQWKAA